MVDMIKKNGLVHGYPAKNWEDRIEEGFGLKSIAIVSNDGENEKKDYKNKKSDSFFHIHYLYGMNLKSVKGKPLFHVISQSFFERIMIR